MFAPAIRKYEVANLEEEIISYLNSRSTMFQQHKDCFKKPKPKTHFLSHYAEAILKYGPSTCVWTARYESKHRVAKMLANSSKNFINIAKTLAIRQQYRQASVYFVGMYDTEEITLPELVKNKLDVLKDICDNENSLMFKIHQFMDSASILCDSIR